MKRHAARLLSSSRASHRVRAFPPSVFSEFTALSLETGSVNLGQGAPDYTPPFVTDAVLRSVRDGHTQYTRSAGHPALVDALAETYSPLFGRELDPVRHFVVTDGATEAGFSAMQALLNEGDEVLLMEPFYDAYGAWCQLAGARPVYVPMGVPEALEGGSAAWTVDVAAMEAAVTDRTKAIVINNPHNPVGRVFTRAELEAVADLARRRDLVVISDEVYEHLVFEGEHTRIATLPGMWERTVTLCSAGKTFSCTGFKVGWVVASDEMCAAVASAHQWVSFCTATPLQNAVAVALRETASSGYLDELRADFTGKRDRLHAALTETGMRPCLPEAGYFVMADYTPLFPSVPREKGDSADYEACRHMTRAVGVTPIPPSAFYSPEHRGQVTHLARFAFCKSGATVDAAIERLRSFAAANK